MGTLLNGIKAIFSTSQSTATHLPTCQSDGTPQGRIDIASLASVLGATMSELGNNADLNELFKAGFYYTNGRDTVINKPNENFYNNTIWVLKNPVSERTTQLFFCINESITFIRYKTDLSWGNWEELSTDIPTFYKNYATLTALRNAIGKIGFVDMGLPSGRLWASKNIGAETITDDGLYFSWGNVDGHTGSDGYDFGNSNDGPYANTEGAALTADITINNDAANFYLGGTCKMPTVADFQELSNNCDSEWITLHGVVGRRFTSRINGNSIFFPASGLRNGASLASHGYYGYYWSSSLGSSAYGYNLNFNSSGVNPAVYDNRFYGFPVRAVQ